MRRAAAHRKQVVCSDCFATWLHVAVFRAVIAFIRRLRRTALVLSAAHINKAIGDMPRRCALLYKAKGELFEEGGRARKAARVQ